MQQLPASSTAEAEYVNLSENANTVVGLRLLMDGLNEPPNDPTFVFQDNTAAIAASKNALNRSRLRHINLRVYNIREPIQCSTTNQHADFCTKALTAPSHTHHTDVAYGTRSSDPPVFLLPAQGPA